MIVTRTPFRISFFGGGTDYPTWYRQEGGAVLSTSIDKYCYLTLRYHPAFFPTAHRIVWSYIEQVYSIGEILHPAVREGLRMTGFDDSRGIEIHHQGDLPARAGMGSSSAFAVGLMQGLLAMKGDFPDPHTLSRLAIELEQNRLNETVGSQDQIAGAFGGFNFIRFNPDDSFSVEPLAASPAFGQLNQRLMLFFLGRSRLATEIASDVVRNIPNRVAQLRRMGAMAEQGRAILTGGELDDFGRLLHEAWMIKRDLSPAVSSGEIDECYDRALAAGALGGKLLGAGGTGFMLFYVPEERQPAVRQALKHLLHVPFGFEKTGSEILYSAIAVPPCQ